MTPAVFFKQSPFADPERVDVCDAPTWRDCLDAVPIPDDRRGGAIVWHAGAPIAGHRLDEPVPDNCFVQVTCPPAFGGNPIKSLLSIGLLILTTAITGGLAAPLLGGAFGAGTWGAAILGGVIGIAGNLAINALFPPPSGGLNDPQELGGGAPLNSARIAGNRLQAGAYYPQVIGTFRIRPPFQTKPIQFLRGFDSVVSEAVFAWNGATSVANPRRGDALTSDDPAVTVELRDGTDDAAPHDLVKRYGETIRLGRQMSKHDLDGDTDELKNQENPIESLPEYHRMIVAKGSDEAHIVMQFIGIFNADDLTEDQNLNFRARIRAEGDEYWQNLPEFGIQGSAQSPFRQRLRLVWGSRPGADEADTSDIFKWFWQEGLSRVDRAHVVASTSDYMMYDVFRNNVATYVEQESEGWSIFLDPLDFPQDRRYEVEIKRSQMVSSANWTGSLYKWTAVGSEDVDLFDAYSDSGTWKVWQTPAGYNEQVILDWLTCIKNANPVPKPGLSSAAVQIVNGSLDDFNVEVSNLVDEWSGAAFDTEQATSYPPAQFRNALTNPDMILRPLATAAVDDTALGDWHDECVAEGYEVNAVFEGEELWSVLRTITGAGLAMRRGVDKFSVTFDTDRSGDAMTHILSPINLADFSFDIDYADFPAQALVGIHDAADGYRFTEFPVDNPFGVEDEFEGVESFRYAGITDRFQAAQRARYDFAQQWIRNLKFSGVTSLDQLLFDKGDIVGISTKLLSSDANVGRIVEVVSGTVIRIDHKITLPDEDEFADADILSTPDLEAVAPYQIAIMNASAGVQVATVSSFDEATRTVTLASSVTATAGDHVCFGGLDPGPVIRCRVLQVRARDALAAKVTLTIDKSEDIFALLDTYKPATVSTDDFTIRNFDVDQTDAEDIGDVQDTTLTIEGLAIGEAYAGRRVYAFISAFAQSSFTTVSGVTIGGETAAEVVSAEQDDNGLYAIAAIWSAVVASGETVDVAVTADVDLFGLRVGAIVIGSPATTGIDTDTAVQEAAGADLDVTVSAGSPSKVLAVATALDNLGGARVVLDPLGNQLAFKSRSVVNAGNKFSFESCFGWVDSAGGSVTVTGRFSPQIGATDCAQAIAACEIGEA